MTDRYTIALRCPRCRKTNTMQSDNPHPIVCCGDCLADDIEVVEMLTAVISDADQLAGYHPGQSDAERKRRGKSTS